MKSTIYFLILIGILVVNGCYNNNDNNNMMGNSNNRNRRTNNMRSINMMTIVYCNTINKDCINNVSTSTTQTQQDTAKQQCSNSFNSCMMMGGGTATMMR